MTTLIALLLITWALTVAGIAAWYRRDRKALVRANRELRDTASTLAADLLEARTDATLATERAEWAELATETARFRAECAETALRGLLHHQARQELTTDAAEQPVGAVLQFALNGGDVVPMKKRARR